MLKGNMKTLLKGFSKYILSRFPMENCIYNSHSEDGQTKKYADQNNDYLPPHVLQDRSTINSTSQPKLNCAASTKRNRSRCLHGDRSIWDRNGSKTGPAFLEVQLSDLSGTD